MPEKINFLTVLRTILFPSGGTKTDLFVTHRAKKLLYGPLVENKCFSLIVRDFFFYYRIKKWIFLLSGHKVHFIAPCGANKSIFSTRGSENIYFCLARGNKIHFIRPPIQKNCVQLGKTKCFFRVAQCTIVFLAWGNEMHFLTR